MSRAPGIITVDVPLGVTARIERQLTTVAEATSRTISETLDPGVYTVRWNAGDMASSRTIRLRSEDTQKLYPDDLIPGASPSEDHDLAARQFNALLQQVSETRRITSLIVYVCANDMRTRSDVGKSVELRSLRGFEKSDAVHVHPYSGQHDSDDGWSLMRFDCDAGAYLLRFVTFDRKTVEQTVFLPHGRTAIVWLRYGSAIVAEGLGEEAKMRTRRGIDPARTLITSLESNESAEALRDRFFLCGALLSDATARRGRLHGATADGLRDLGDPFARMYGTAILLTRPLASDELWPDDSERPMAVPSRNFEIAREFLDGLGHAETDWPDVLAGRWRLALAQEALLSEPGGAFDSALGLSPSLILSAPPMLESAWRWASSWSIQHPEALEASGSPTIAAVAKGQERTTPWLTWKADDARAAQRRDTYSSSDATEGGMRVVAEISAQLEIGGNLAAIANTVSQPARDFVNTLMRVAPPDAWSKAGEALMSRLAGATGLPMAELASTASAVFREINASTTKLEATSGSDLLQKDHNQGLFGGEPARNGFEVRLAGFEKANDPEYLALDLEVRGTGEKRLEGVVTFYLHPTFTPPQVVAVAVDGLARYTCYAWGGFTLGVETADGTRMELDLAADRRLPKWFRSR